MPSFVLALLLAATLSPDSLSQVSLTPRGSVLRIGVTGDTGSGADAVAAGLRAVHAKAPLDAIILTGDTFYPCGVTSEHDPRWSLVTPITSIGVPVFPVLGNHDYCGGSDVEAQIGAPIWTFPARQYAVRSPLADFAFLDTTPFVRGDGPPPDAVLRSAFRTSSTPWRIVVGHHPVISSGWHGYFPRDEVKRMRELIPALRETKADLYICGHDHQVELLRGRMAHLVSGAGSAPVPPVKLRASTVFPPEITRERIGFAVVEIEARRIRVRFYDAKGRPRSEWIPARVKSARTSPAPCRTTSSPSTPRRDRSTRRPAAPRLSPGGA
jgi:tartrate-resistant acid phosphatase type 5